jgi:hypothetical protein
MILNCKIYVSFQYRFTAEMKLKIDLPGEKASEKGQALFEIMMLR